MDKLIAFVQANPKKANMIGLGIGALLGAVFGGLYLLGTQDAGELLESVGEALETEGEMPLLETSE